MCKKSWQSDKKIVKKLKQKKVTILLRAHLSHGQRKVKLGALHCGTQCLICSICFVINWQQNDLQMSLPVRFSFKEINAFIQQEHITLIKSDNKDIFV